MTFVNFKKGTLEKEIVKFFKEYNLELLEEQFKCINDKTYQWTFICREVVK